MTDLKSQPGWPFVLSQTDSHKVDWEWESYHYFTLLNIQLAMLLKKKKKKKNGSDLINPTIYEVKKHFKILYQSFYLIILRLGDLRWPHMSLEISLTLSIWAKVQVSILAKNQGECTLREMHRHKVCHID